MTIGVFDSGLGGLTVARAIRRLLPDADLIYYGDTARVPYGPKSAEAVTNYSLEIADFLLAHGVQMLVVACNTASAWALETLQRKLTIPVIGVIEAGVRSLLASSKAQQVAVIGTRGTIDSGSYQKLVQQYCPQAKLTCRACPLLVPLVEEQWLDHPVTDQVIREYLGDLKRSSVDAVLLACTHYPLLKPAIQRVLAHEVRIVDSADAVAAELLERDQKEQFSHGSGSVQAYVSDDPAHFALRAEPFFGEMLNTKLAPVTPVPNPC